MIGWCKQCNLLYITLLYMWIIYTSSNSHMMAVEQTQIYHTKAQNNSFTFQQFTANNNIHYNWHKTIKWCVGNKRLKLLMFFWCLEAVEHQNSSTFFFNKHKTTLLLNCAMFGLWWCAHIQLTTATFNTECVVCYCDVVLKYINIMKKVKFWKNSTTWH